MAKGIFLTPKDVMKLRGYSNYKNAWRYLNNLAKELKKPAASSITIEEFANVYGIKKEAVLKALDD